MTDKRTDSGTYIADKARLCCIRSRKLVANCKQLIKKTAAPAPTKAQRGKAVFLFYLFFSILSFFYMSVNARRALRTIFFILLFLCRVSIIDTLFSFIDTLFAFIDTLLVNG